MPDFVLNRNFNLPTVFGHIIEFKKGKPTHVPQVCVHAVVAIGATPVDGPIDLLGDEDEPEVPMSPDDRVGNINAAFKLLEEAGSTAENRENFTAAGRPAKKAVEAITGFTVDNRELADMWVAYVAAKSTAE